MPIRMDDPFWIAQSAAWAATKAQRSARDMVFLRAFYKESGANLSYCQIVTATYLAWHESLTKSGVRFEEHAAALDMPGCKLDDGLYMQRRDQRDAERRDAMEAAIAAHEKQKRQWMIAGGIGAAVLASAGFWILQRRRARMQTRRTDWS